MGVDLKLRLPSYVTVEMIKTTINKVISEVDSYDEINNKVNFVFDGFSFAGKNMLNKTKELESLKEKQKEEEKNESFQSKMIKKNIDESISEIDLIKKANDCFGFNEDEKWQSLFAADMLTVYLYPMLIDDINVSAALFTYYKSPDEKMPKGDFSTYLSPRSNFHWALFADRLVDMFGGKIVWADHSDSDGEGNYKIVEIKNALYSPKKSMSEEEKEKLFFKSIQKLAQVDDKLISKIEERFDMTDGMKALLEGLENQKSIKEKSLMLTEIPKSSFKNKVKKF